MLGSVHEILLVGRQRRIGNITAVPDLRQLCGMLARYV